jgi:hypothetical protein
MISARNGPPPETFRCRNLAAGNPPFNIGNSTALARKFLAISQIRPTRGGFPWRADLVFFWLWAIQEGQRSLAARHNQARVSFDAARQGKNNRSPTTQTTPE